MDKKITLIITGQLRLQENQKIQEKINYPAFDLPLITNIVM
jgi:hypothetical protein